MTWNEKDADQSITNGCCLICKKIKLAKEMRITLNCAVGIEKVYPRAFLCVECFERDISVINDIDEEKKDDCGVCFICEEKLENVRYDAAEIKDTYTFEILGDPIKDNRIFCFHLHKECYESSADDQWIFDGKRN